MTMTAITSDSYHAMHGSRTQGHRTGATVNRAITVSGLSEWQVNALRKLASFGGLQANWDSYGSSPVSDEVLDIATDIVTSITLDHLPVPKIIPISGGGVQIGWERQDREVEVEVHPDLTIEVLLSKNGQPCDDIPLQGINASLIGPFLNWLYVR